MPLSCNYPLNSKKEKIMTGQIQLGNEFIAETETIDEVAAKIATALVDEIDQQHRRMRKAMDNVYKAADVKEPEGFSPLSYQFSSVALGLKHLIEATMPLGEGYGSEPILKYQTSDLRILPVFRRGAAAHLMQFLPVVNSGDMDICEIESNHKWVLAGTGKSGVACYVGFAGTDQRKSVAARLTKSGVETGFFIFPENILSQPLNIAPRFSAFIAIAHAIHNVNIRVDGREWYAAPPSYAIFKQADGQYRRK